MSKIYNSLTELIGITPLLRLVGYEKQNGLQATIVAILPDTGERYLST